VLFLRLVLKLQGRDLSSIAKQHKLSTNLRISQTSAHQDKVTVQTFGLMVVPNLWLEGTAHRTLPCIPCIQAPVEALALSPRAVSNGKPTFIEHVFHSI
jgi:hypothetical protein